MPELPEVETVVRNLSTLESKKIKTIEVKKWFLIKELRDYQKENFDRIFENEKITKIERKGKYIFFILTNWTLIFHLRMTGKFFFEKYFDSERNSESLGITFAFDDKTKLFFCDHRNFATFHFQNVNVYKNSYPYNSIGVDILNEEIDEKSVFEIFSKKRIPIKTALLQQNVISGIGNIYASEILFFSKISPFVLSNSISEVDYKKIFFFSKEIIKKSVEMGGTSIVDFLNPLGKPGLYQKELKVYGRNGFSCSVCNGIIEKAYIDKRSTYFCRTCQSIQI